MREISVSANILKFPGLCCCCGVNPSSSEYSAEASRTTGKRVIKTVSKAWRFPICAKCLEWISAEKFAHRMGVACFLFSGLFFYLLSQQLYAYMAAGFVFATFVIYTWKNGRKRADKIKPDPSCRVTPVIYKGWYGTVHSFEMANDNFAEQFEILNSKKLVG